MALTAPKPVMHHVVTYEREPDGVTWAATIDGKSRIENCYGLQDAQVRACAALALEHGLGEATALVQASSYRMTTAEPRRLLEEAGVRFVEQFASLATGVKRAMQKVERARTALRAAELAAIALQRCEAIALLERGYSPADIGTMLAVDQGQIRTWERAHRREATIKCRTRRASANVSAHES